MILYSITGNLAFDYFFSINLNLGLLIWGLMVVIKLLKN